MKFINNFFKLLVMFFLVLSVFKDNTLLVRGEETNKLQNKLQNGGFEDSQTWEDNTYKQPDQSLVPSWNTTAFEGKVELFRTNTGVYIPGVTLSPKEGNYAAELNADEESTLYQVVNTKPASIYEWGLYHGARNGSDTMALVIGPNQTNSPSKPTKSGRDQFMQMADYLTEIGLVKENITNAGIYNNGNPIVLYSKPFGTNGTFENNTDNDPFSLVLTESHTEQWYIWIITDERGTNEKVWNGYGLNDTSATNKYYRYMVPDNQNQTIFGFVSVGYTDNNATGDKQKTYGNFLDGINFKIYYPVSGSSTGNGSGNIISSDKALGESNLIDYDHKLDGYVEENVDLEVRAKINKANQNTVKFIGFAYSYIDGNGNTVNSFISYKPGTDSSWEVSETDTEIVYKYMLKGVSSAVDIHLIFIESPTVTYDSNGGRPYCVNNGTCRIEDKKYNVYSFEPQTITTEDKTTIQFISPYTAHSAEGQNEKWKFIGWEVYDDNGKVQNLMLNGDHSVAYNYKNQPNTSTFTILDQVEFTGGYTTVEDGIEWNYGSNKPVYNELSGGLTMVAKWRYRETFIPQTYKGSIYENSNEGGTVTITKTTDYDSDNSACSLDKMSYATCYYASNMEEMSVTATANSGYVFEGWYDESGNLITRSNKYTFSENKGATYYARFTSMVTQSFVRQIEDNGNWTNITDDKIGTLTVYSHTNSIGSVVKSTALETTGYKFIGWYDENGIPVNSSMLTNDGKSITYTTTGNATYYARFEIAYRINFIAQSRQSDNSYKNLSASLNLVPAFLENIAGQTVSATAKDYTGYTFKGWYDANGNAVDSSMLTDDGKTITVTTSSENHNTTYYARYYANDTKLIYNANYADSKGDTATSTLNGKVDDKVTVNNGSLFKRAGYTFVKWNTKKDGKGTDYIANSEYQLKASDTILYAIWKANDDTVYKIEHYKVNYDTNGTASASLAASIYAKGTTDTKVTIGSNDLKNYEGYSYDPSYVGTINSGIIKGDGSLVLKLYYVANEVKLIYDPNDGINKDGISESDTVVIGHTDQVVKLKNGDSLFDRFGYIFKGWGTTNNAVAYQQGDKYTFTKDEKQILYAIWEARSDMPYVVEYYYQKADGTYPNADELTSDDKVTRNDGNINASIKIKDSDTIAKTGYVFDKDNENNILETTISKDGVPVLRLYFKLQFTVTYELDGGISTTEQLVYENLDYNEDTPLIDEPKKVGYHFEGYDIDVADKVTANATYKALWKANDDTKYVVNHYLVSNDGNTVSYTLYQSDVLTGTTDETVYASSLDISGYKYNKDYNAEGIADVSSGVVKGDGTLVLKLYYVNDTSNTRLVYKANGGIGADVIQVGSVNEEVIVKSGTIFKRDGYAFVGWNTKADGSGVMYHAFGSYRLKENDNVLYAIWVKMLDDYIPPVCGIDN